MASSKEYLDYILDQLSGLDDISWRAMMKAMIGELTAPKRRRTC